MSFPVLVQVSLTMFYVFWLVATLLLLWRIWLATMRHIHSLERELLEVARQSAQAAQDAALAARRLAEKAP